METGRKVKEISWGCGRDAEFMASGYGVTLEILNEFHGEYDLDWVVKKIDGREVVRYNCKTIDTIVWEEEE